MPTQKEQIEKLTAENDELKDLVKTLTERLDKAEATLDALSVNQSENLTRLEAVEDNLCQVTAEQLELQQDQADLTVRLEAQQMYSRKQTLLLTGKAVEGPTRGENIRLYVINLLREYMGITDIQPHDICACHRLRNQKVILVRFVSLDNADRVYRGRTKQKKRGLLVFESLTSERLATLNVVKDIKQAEQSPIHSYYTQGGKIFVRLSENKDLKPIEIPFAATRVQIMDLCKGKKVTLSPLAIRDHVRQVHGVSGQNRGQTSHGSGSGGSGAVGHGSASQAWKKVPPKKSSDPASRTVTQPSGADQKPAEADS